jgi:hypothetical protein
MQITVKHTVHEDVINTIASYFEVTKVRARKMLTGELERHGMTNDSVIVLATNPNSMTYEICNNIKPAKELASIYDDHRIVHLATGNLFVIRSPKGRGRYALEPFGGEVDEQLEEQPTPEPVEEPKPTKSKKSKKTKSKRGKK